jgi:hypothetical protein
LLFRALVGLFLADFRVTSHAGSGLKLPCWDAVRKHLSPTWWSNPTRGGNKNRDFSQSYQEHMSGSFASQGELLEQTHPEILRDAVAAWEAWYAQVRRMPLPLARPLRLAPC